MSDSNVYTAERIQAKRIRDGVTQYCIKWQGYSSRYNTWEPLENIIDRGLLDDFERSESKKCKRTNISQLNNKDQDPDRRSNKTESRFDHSRRSSCNLKDAEQSNIIEPSTQLKRPLRLPTRLTKSKTELVSCSASDNSSTVDMTLSHRSNTHTPDVPVISPSAVSRPISVKSIAFSPGVVDSTTCPESITPRFAISADHKITLPVNADSQSYVRPRSQPNISSGFTNDVRVMDDTLSSNSHSTIKPLMFDNVITDVAVDDQVVTISESKVGQGQNGEISLPKIQEINTGKDR